MDNFYFVTNFSGGGYYTGSTFVPETSDWKKIGSLKKARGFHGASLVSPNDVIDHCKSFLKQTRSDTDFFREVGFIAP